MIQRQVIRLTMVCLLIAVAFPCGVNAAPDSVNAAKAFLDSLPDDQRTLASQPSDSSKRTDWHFFPREREGVPLGNLTSAQEGLAKELLRTVLSDTGLEQTLGVINCERALAAKEGADKRDPGKFQLVIWGPPRADGDWGWRFEGHHLSVNVTLEGNEIKGVTPIFIGANPATVLDGEFAGFRNMPMEEDLAFEFLASLTKDQKTKALVSDQPVEVEGAGRSSMSPSLREGLPVTEVTEAQLPGLVALIGAYVDCFNGDALLSGTAEELAADQSLVFQWRGGMTDGEACSYRISSNTLDIQFINQQNNANHVHTVMWFLGKDFGG